MSGNPNIISMKEICCLFCCPPLPSRIAAKLAFLPPDPTYNLTSPQIPKKCSHDKGVTETDKKHLGYKLSIKSNSPLVLETQNNHYTTLEDNGNQRVSSDDSKNEDSKNISQKICSSISHKFSDLSRRTGPLFSTKSRSLCIINGRKISGPSEESNVVTTPNASSSSATGGAGNVYSDSTNNQPENHDDKGTKKPSSLPRGNGRNDGELVDGKQFLKDADDYTLKVIEDIEKEFPSYGIHLSPRAEWQYGAKELDRLDAFTAVTRRGCVIPCLMVRCGPATKKLTIGHKTRNHNHHLDTDSSDNVGIDANCIKTTGAAMPAHSLYDRKSKLINSAELPLPYSIFDSPSTAAILAAIGVSYKGEKLRNNIVKTDDLVINDSCKQRGPPKKSTNRSVEALNVCEIDKVQSRPEPLRKNSLTVESAKTDTVEVAARDYKSGGTDKQNNPRLKRACTVDGGTAAVRTDTTSPPPPPNLTTKPSENRGNGVITTPCGNVSKTLHIDNVNYRQRYKPTKYTILFSHGNAVDLGQMSSFYLGLGSKLGCDVVGYDYSGYGQSYALTSNILASAAPSCCVRKRPPNNSSTTPEAFCCSKSLKTMRENYSNGLLGLHLKSPIKFSGKSSLSETHEQHGHSDLASTKLTPTDDNSHSPSPIARLSKQFHKGWGGGTKSVKPSESNLYADAEAAFKAILKRYDLSPDRVVLYGQSIGTVPTIHLASASTIASLGLPTPPAGVILHSPLISGLRVAFPFLLLTSPTPTVPSQPRYQPGRAHVLGDGHDSLFYNQYRAEEDLLLRDLPKWAAYVDAFYTPDKLKKIEAKNVLVIHGTSDDVIDHGHGRAVFSLIPPECTVDPLWVSGAGHNDIEMHSEYITRLKKYFKEDLP